MPHTLGEAIKYARRVHHWSGAHLARAATLQLTLDDSISTEETITRSAVAQWETGKKKIPVFKLQAIEKALGVTFNHKLRAHQPPHHYHRCYDTGAGPVSIALTDD